MSTLTQEDFLDLYNKLPQDSKKKLTGVAKWFTIIIIGLVFAIGVLGSFKISNFEMNSYIKFLDSFKWFISPLILSIGAGSVIKGLGNNKVKEVEKVDELSHKEMMISPEKEIEE